MPYRTASSQPEVGTPDLNKYLSARNAIAAGMRLPLKLYVFTLKMETDGYATRALRRLAGWRIEVVVTAAQIDSVPDLSTNGFELSTYDPTTDQYIFAQSIE
jgi:hypothetical protein